MFNKSNFHFHRFENENSSSQLYNTQNSNFNFFNSNQINEPNLNNTYRSLNSETQKYKSNNGYKTFRTSYSYNLRNSNNNNRQLNINKYPFNENKEFPEKEILGMKKFDFIINYDDISKIEKVLPQMVYGKYNKERSPYFNLLIKNFQLILQYLFEYNDNINEYNNNLDYTLNDNNSEINQLTNRLKYDISVNEKIINDNAKTEKKYRNKLNNYKNNLISKGIDLAKVKKKLPLDIHDDDGFFYCDICPNKKFKSYEKIYEHYIKKHSNSSNINLGNLIFQNSNFQKYYFDNELNKLRRNLRSSIFEIYKKNNEETKKEIEKLENEKIKQSILNKEINKNNNDFFNNKTVIKSSIRNSIIGIRKNNLNGDVQNKLNNLKYNQNKQFEYFQNEFEEFQNQIYNQLLNFSKGKPIIIPKKTNKYIIRKINNEIIGEEYISDSKNNQNNNLKNQNINNEKNKVIQEGTNLLNQNKYIESDEIINEDINENIKLRAIKNSKFNNYNNKNEIDDLYNRYMNREKNILLNPHYNTIEKTLKEYNFLNLIPKDKEKSNIEKSIENLFYEYNVDFENIKSLNKDDYLGVINNIFFRNKIESKNQNEYGEYMNSLLNKINIDQLIENLPEIKNIINDIEEMNENYSNY